MPCRGFTVLWLAWFNFLWESKRKIVCDQLIHAWVIFFPYLRQGGFGLVICVWQSFILDPHKPAPNYHPLRSKPSPPDLERTIQTISDFIQCVAWKRPESLGQLCCSHNPFLLQNVIDLDREILSFPCVLLIALSWSFFAVKLCTVWWLSWFFWNEAYTLGSPEPPTYCKIPTSKLKKRFKNAEIAKNDEMMSWNCGFCTSQRWSGKSPTRGE